MRPPCATEAGVGCRDGSLGTTLGREPAAPGARESHCCGHTGISGLGGNRFKKECGTPLLFIVRAWNRVRMRRSHLAVVQSGLERSRVSFIFFPSGAYYMENVFLLVSPEKHFSNRLITQKTTTTSDAGKTGRGLAERLDEAEPCKRFLAAGFR